MESSVEVLKELASREQALSGKVTAAIDEAAKIVANAEAKAKEILAQAEAEAAKLTTESRAKRETEEKNILDSSLATAKTAAEGLRSTAESKVADAVKHIVSRVLP